MSKWRVFVHPKWQFFDRNVNISEARSTDVVSYLRYDYRLWHVLWMDCMVAATHVVRPLFYHTYDLLSWSATLVRQQVKDFVKLKEYQNRNSVFRICFFSVNYKILQRFYGLLRDTGIRTLTDKDSDTLSPSYTILPMNTNEPDSVCLRMCLSTFQTHAEFFSIHSWLGILLAFDASTQATLWNNNMVCSNVRRHVNRKNSAWGLHSGRY